VALNLRIATFNIENLDDEPGDDPTLAERIAVLRPALERLRADVLCLQEVHGQEQAGQPRELLAARGQEADSKSTRAWRCRLRRASGARRPSVKGQSPTSLHPTPVAGQFIDSAFARRIAVRKVAMT
jgi:endonuclease/exonuclease/phosphatase family metal-dependent hydrolase